MKKLFVVIMSVTLALTATACSSGSADSSATAATMETTAAVSDADIKEKLDNILSKKYFEGIVYLTQNGEVIYQSETGKDENGADLTINSAMYIGSISKQFCSAAILYLRDQGKLSVDDTLDKYYPEYAEGKKITLKNMLSMRSGIPDIANKSDSSLNVEGISSDKTEEENTAAIKEWIFSQPLAFEPDSSFSYCNSNYFLLSNIVEEVTGHTYNDFIRQNFFEPLDMAHSGFISEVKDSPEWASGLNYDSFTQLEDSPGLTQGAGDITSDAVDMDKWMTALSSGKVICADSYSEMTTNYSPDSSNGYGFGMFVSYSGGVGHSGFIGKYTSFDYINEEHGYNLFIASNKSYMEIESLPMALLQDLV